MDYNEKIKQLEAELTKLKSKAEMAGKFYKFNDYTLMSIKNVSEIEERNYTGTTIVFDSEVVFISDNKVEVSKEKWSSYIDPNSEITREEYYEWYDKAIEFINKLKT